MTSQHLAEGDDRNDLGIAYGAEAIASILGLTRKQIYHGSERGYLPVFRIGNTLCARRRTLRRWVEDLERNAGVIERQPTSRRNN